MEEEHDAFSLHSDYLYTILDLPTGRHSTMETASGSSASSSASAIVSLLTSLPLTSPALLSLLSKHRVFVRPSQLPSSASKLVVRINTAVLSRDAVGVEEKLASLMIAQELVLQDTEGWVLAGWGKGWVGSTLGALSVSWIPIIALGSQLIS